MAVQKTLGETLAEIKAARQVSPIVETPYKPSWAELRLDVHVRRLRMSLALYVATLAMFWCHVFGVVTFPLSIVLTFILVAPANYLFLTWTAYTMQKHGGWQVWVGALLLNPVILGWYIPVSVAMSASRIRRQLNAC